MRREEVFLLFCRDFPYWRLSNRLLTSNLLQKNPFTFVNGLFAFLCLRFQLGLCFAFEALFVDNGALVGTLADEALLVIRRNLEGQNLAVGCDFGQLGFKMNLHACRGRRHMAERS